MQPRIKYITKGCLAGLVRASRVNGYVHQVAPKLVKSIPDDDPPSALVTSDIRNGILTAELWTETDVRRHAEHPTRFLDINFETYLGLPELDKQGRVVREERPPEQPKFIINSRSGPIHVMMPGTAWADHTFRNWQAAIIPVLEEFRVRFVKVSWMWSRRRGRALILKLLPARRTEAASLLCPVSQSADEVGRRCAEALSRVFS